MSSCAAVFDKQREDEEKDEDEKRMRMKVWSRCVIVTVLCEAVRLGSRAESVFRLYIDIHTNLFSKIKKKKVRKKKNKEEEDFI